MKVYLDKILVEPIDEEEKTKSGIIIVETDESKQTKSKKGKVIDVGNGIEGEPMDVKIGDIVYYSAYAGHKVTKDNKDYVILLQREILFAE